MNRKMLVAAIVVAAGCGNAGGSGPLDVEMLSLSGQIGGVTAPTVTDVSATGQGDGQLATFFVESRELSFQLSACMPDDSQLDPYGGGGVIPDPNGGPPIFQVDDGASASTVRGIDCIGHALSICMHGTCTQFDESAVDLQIVEENGWRRVTAAANNASGTVNIALRFHEQH